VILFAYLPGITHLKFNYFLSYCHIEKIDGILVYICIKWVLE
jgi:hypothetical protein